ncbi:hypothetical protein IGI04_026276 [Brassica rapa subsp. trilocularis]|uniref:Uncharacterized protein n=1 Tax=Brassica rapa subsp. trilocularis TaxID=1813537 RepID=A0ABQ7KYM2_BRACM|nr:hypothetical protein IGI04_026276 [Brassica rapa subsp. trilocularis]
MDDNLDLLPDVTHRSNKKEVGKAEIQYEGFDRLVVSFEEVPIRSCGQYVRYSPELKRPDLHAGSAPCTDPWTAVYQKGQGWRPELESFQSPESRARRL